jgi:DNA-binding CsgD family transcriptional regulator
MMGAMQGVQLSPREEQLLYLIADECLSLKEVAFRMKISLNSVRPRASRLYRKLGLHLQGGQPQRLMTKWYWKRLYEAQS